MASMMCDVRGSPARTPFWWAQWCRPPPIRLPPFAACAVCPRPVHSVSVKFCGLVRPADAEEAGRLGAEYAGVIFAGGPRLLDPERGAEVLDAAGDRVRRVGVFGSQPPALIARVARGARLHVVQLHADPMPRDVVDVRAATGCRVWAVVRVTGSLLSDTMLELSEVADAVVLDARVPGRLGGTGTALDWDALAQPLRRARGDAALVLAGGLAPENVGAAIALLAPHVVDVSSGVEREPGVKDHERMRQFLRAARRTPRRVR